MRKHDSEKEIMESCPILYCQRNAPMTATCMCWGFECGEGWYDIIETLSNKLEALNLLFYPDFKTRIQADQVKEKFGTLHFYFSVHTDTGSWLRNKTISVLDKLAERLRFKPIDYKYKTVVDKKAWTETVEDVFKSEADWFKEKHKYRNCSNVKFFNENGVFTKVTTYNHYEQTHREPTQHVIRYKFINWLERSVIKLTCGRPAPSSRSMAVYELMYSLADKYVRDAEQDCNNVCEHCGATICGVGWDERCTTVGWIKYMCKDCCEERDFGYYYKGEYWEGKNRIRTKEENDAWKAEIEAKHKVATDNYKAEEEEFQKQLKEIEAREGNRLQ